MEITPNMTPEQYVDQLVQEDEALRSIREAIVKEGMPEVSVAHPYGKLLTFLIEVSGAQHVLEIGVLGGYSGLCLVRGLGEKSSIVSLELKEAYAALAHRHMENNGYGDRVEYRIGPAADSLKELQEEGRTFDFSSLMQIRKITQYIWNMRLLWRIQVPLLRETTVSFADGR